MKTANLNRSHRLPGLVTTDHFFELPLVHDKPKGEQITVFAREVVSADKARAASKLPWLIFFQGGPGFGSPRPEGNAGWLKRALKDYRVLLLDPRGTALSSPITFQTLAHMKSSEQQAEYLMNFRADAIVKDAELIRKQMCGDEQWTALGQSFGGFCITTYLSIAQEGLKEAVITGGLPPIGVHIDDVYRATFLRVIGKNRAYFERYPQDAQTVLRIVDFLQKNKVELPAGGVLTPRRFQQLGLVFGFQNGFERIHYLLQSAFVNAGKQQEMNFAFLKEMEAAPNFETNPIYILLHEAIYCEGNASNWSAHRMQNEFKQFDVANKDSLYLTGEMVYPWMCDDYKYLQPLKATAELLAKFQDWGPLYDTRRLSTNEVPVAAAMYYDDMYVETAYSQQAADLIKGCRLWVTNQYEHDGIRMDGETVLNRLLGMLHGEF
jgi:pimeloyl-ACP methyl ester carboxylesterase